MDAEELKGRTKQFGIRVFRLAQSLSTNQLEGTVARQLLRSGTSVGANYRAACRARSDADFVAKMAIVEEETDEAIYWMELLAEMGMVPKERLSGLMQEADEILRIVVASINTVKSRTGKSRRKKSAIPNPKSAIPNPKSAIPNPKSA